MTREEKLECLATLTKSWRETFDTDIRPRLYARLGAIDLSDQISRLLLDPEIPIAPILHERQWLVDAFRRVRCFIPPHLIPWGQGRNAEGHDLKMCADATLRHRRRVRSQPLQQQEAS